jgi:hypothetical protein
MSQDIGLKTLLQEASSMLCVMTNSSIEHENRNYSLPLCT